MSVETHEFTVDKSIIIHLIKSQAGSLGKAVLECVMNSADAGATQVRIDVNSDTMTITDNGHGLRTREEILEVFNRFGFDHAGHDRTYGKFGLGRGQLWNFASTLWHSHGFVLDVDVRERGLQWNLHVGQPHTEGVRIEASFYDPMSAVAIVELRNDLERLCKYAAIEVLFNGQRIGKDPAGVKWDFETEDAYFRINDTYSLNVYNQGVHVCDLYRGTVGVGGVVVSKVGVPLTLNMARNDVNRADCPVWKRIAAVLRQLAAERTSAVRAARLTAEDRDYLARQTVDPEYRENLERPIFTLTDGKNWTLRQLLNRAGNGRATLTTAERGSRVAESLMRERLAVVLDASTLARFGAATVGEFVQTLRERSADETGWVPYGLKDINVVESIADCKGYKQLLAQRIARKDLTAEQALFLEVAGQMLYQVTNILHYREGYTDQDVTRRDLFLGKGDMEAYTDGQTYVAIVDTTAQAVMRGGLAGFLRLTHILVHELLHDSDDSGSHSHDAEFYEAFHDIVLDKAEGLTEVAAQAFRTWLKKSKKKLSRAKAADLDTLAADPALAA